MSETCVRVNLRVTREARAEWEQLAAKHHVTASALGEAIGLLVIGQGRPLSEAIGRAQQVTHNRLRRADT